MYPKMPLWLEVSNQHRLGRVGWHATDHILTLCFVVVLILLRLRLQCEKRVQVKKKCAKMERVVWRVGRRDGEGSS